MLALFGEHLLPGELTDALHSLEDDTAALAWAALEPTVKQQLGDRYGALEIEATPIGAASLGQVHLARCSDAALPILCLKIQYPGIADSIASDFDDVIALLRLANWLPSGREAENWLAEIRALLLLEVDYEHEARMTSAFAKLVNNDPRYVVPRVYKDWSGERILALEYLPGLAVTDRKAQTLALPRRNALGKAMLDLLFAEIFDWGVVQTDPNFGNYRIQVNKDQDKLVLLDFGAVRKLNPDFLNALRLAIVAAYRNDIAKLIEACIALGCLEKNHPEDVKHSFAFFCISLLEPLRPIDETVPGYAINQRGQYRWKESRLLKRAGKLAAQSAISAHFTMPPKEFVLISRKLTGVFTFISVLGCQFNGQDLLEQHVHRWDKRQARL